MRQGEQETGSEAESQSLSNSEAQKATDGIPLGGGLYVVGALLFLSCFSGFWNLVNYTLGDPQAVLPSAPQAFFIVHGGVSSIALALHLWAIRLFLARSKRFSTVFTLAIIANFLFSTGMAYWHSLFSSEVQDMFFLLLSSGVLSVALILYVKKSQRSLHTFTNP